MEVSSASPVGNTLHVVLANPRSPPRSVSPGHPQYQAVREVEQTAAGVQLLQLDDDAFSTLF